jgi:fatty-acyl-CoA synthase
LAEGSRTVSRPLNAWVRALSNVSKLAEKPTVTLPTLVDTLADRFGDRPALISTHAMLSYRGLAERSNQYARWALANDVRPGDVVCLLMPNCPEYVAIWMGITRVGGVVALINTSLTEDALHHSIVAAAAKRVLADTTLAGAIATIRARLSPDIQCWVYGPGPFRRIDKDLEQYHGDRLAPSEQRTLSVADPALYIYTSGTTGLPKAATISHYRVLEWSYWFAGMLDTTEADRLYNCLPMYHSTGGVVAIGALLVNGGSVVIRRNFSASRFWDDIVGNECTIFQYIGELCRYLLNSPSHQRETEHRLRVCCGNGLQPDIWEAFQGRFHIPQILEFYASTEGNVSLYNCEGKPGAIGRIPTFLAHNFPVALIKCDASGEPVRDALGYCVRCETGEPGEAIGKIDTNSGPNMSAFEGYTDRRASAAKILRNVFADGDKWFRSGDLMRRDKAGFFYFVDRVGDTFRWKGENVSTTEVSQVIHLCMGVHQAVVYGVTVPGTEGRAGMATITVAPDFELDSLRRHLMDRLPSFARPVFVRITPALEATGTFKATKSTLVQEGFDPGKTPDAIYFDDRSAGMYVKVDADLFRAIAGGRVRL